MVWWTKFRYLLCTPLQAHGTWYLQSSYCKACAAFRFALYNYEIQTFPVTWPVAFYKTDSKYYQDVWFLYHLPNDCLWVPNKSCVLYSYRKSHWSFRLVWRVSSLFHTRGSGLELFFTNVPSRQLVPKSSIRFVLSIIAFRLALSLPYTFFPWNHISFSCFSFLISLWFRLVMDNLSFVKVKNISEDNTTSLSSRFLQKPTIISISWPSTPFPVQW